MTKTISICNVKGGVGKTTTTLFLSNILSEHEKVLMIDLDSQNSLTSYYVEDFDKIENKTILQTLLDETPITETIISINDNLDFIPADIELCRLTTALTELPELQLCEVLEGIKNNYDFIILDCPPNLNLETRQALAISDIIITPTLLEKWSMRSLNIVADYVNNKNTRLQKRTGSQLEKHVILPTMTEKNRSVQEAVLEDLNATYGTSVMEGISRRTDVQKLAYLGVGAPISQTDTYKEYKSITTKILTKEAISA